MATATDPETPPAVAPDTPDCVPYLLSSDEFFRAIEAEVFASDRRIELWDGRIFEKMAKTRPHSGCTATLTTVLIRTLPRGWCAWPENPILLDTYRAPLPDVTILRGVPYDYLHRTPAAEDISIIIEVAQTSYRKDVGPRLEAYARWLVPVYWVVNLSAHRIEVFWQPQVRDGLGIYQSSRTYGPEDTIPLVLDGREVAQIPARDILPPAPEVA